MNLGLIKTTMSANHQIVNRPIHTLLVRTLEIALMFTSGVLIASPTATTFPATSVTPGGVTLNGAAINNNDTTTKAWFQYGPTTSYGQETAKRPLNLSTGATPVSYSNTLSGLTVGTTYHFCAVATNATGTSYGADFTFTTQPATIPTITTNFASVPGITNVMLNGRLIANGLTSGAWFEWGLTTNYGHTTMITNLDGGTTAQKFSANIGSLDVGVVYYFRAVATNSLGTSHGVGQSFVTATFANVSTVAGGLTGVNSGSTVWGDYDNDGLLDYLTVGTSYTGFAQIWHNTGSNFINVTATVAPGLKQGAWGFATWGDYDNDGRLDFIIGGEVTVNGFQTPYTQIWHNTGTNFEDVTTTVAPGLPQLDIGCVAWGDYDNDGRLDFLLTGDVFNGFSGTSQIWHNTGTNFVNVTATIAPDLTGVAWSSVAWGDYDNDGLLDFLILGNLLNNTSSCQIWHNTGSNFVNVTAIVAPDLTGNVFGSASFGPGGWGDYDNDGWLDFIITSGNLSIWHNTGSNFINATATLAPSVPSVSYAAWVDYDNDGRLDLLLNGSQIWRNFMPQNSNTPPTAPISLAMTSSTNGVLFSWRAATDLQTPSHGLTYNVRAGTTPGGADLLAPNVNPTNGLRSVPAIGNAQTRLFLPLANVANGQKVYWSVQAVDSAFTGGPFATECSVVSTPTMSLAANAGTNIVLSWYPPTWGWHLQENSDLIFGTWRDSPIGEINPVTIPSTNTARFFRLFNP